jgi:transcriptional regulator of acetoin/glycerol metabolism
VVNPWMARIPSTTAERNLIERAKSEVASLAMAEGIRSTVRDSWLRSLHHRVNPNVREGQPVFTEEDLREYRLNHILAPLVPIVHRLLLTHTMDQGLIVAIGDSQGRLLWVEGDRSARRAADAMGFSEGSDWSEAAMGTSAPGTALALDHGIQIHGPEHFAEVVAPWSCTAVPIHHPEDRRVIGVVDITGGPDAVHPAAMPLLEATVAAMEAELYARRLDNIVSTRRRGSSVPVVASSPVLRLLGRDLAVIEQEGVEAWTLSARHSEILALLAWHKQGLSAQALTQELHGEEGSVVTIRAEMTRLKKILDARNCGFRIESRPYRIEGVLDSDAQIVLSFLDRGAHRVALAKYAGRLLPDSVAPGVEKMREDLRVRVREALMQDASAEVLLDYARTEDALDDVEVWQCCLRLLAPGSPKRAAVVLRLEALESARN